MIQPSEHMIEAVEAGHLDLLMVFLRTYLS